MTKHVATNMWSSAAGWEWWLKKIKFFLFRAMETYNGSRSTAPPILNLGTRWQWLTSRSGCLPLWGKSPAAHCTGGGWIPRQVQTFWRREKPPVPTGNRTPTVQPDPDRYTDCATLAPHPQGTLSKCPLITCAKSNAADSFVCSFHATAVHSVCPCPFTSDTSDKCHDHSALRTVHGDRKARYWYLAGVCKTSCYCHFCGLSGITFRHAAAGGAVSHGHWDERSDSWSKYPRIKQ